MHTEASRTGQSPRGAGSPGEVICVTLEKGQEHVPPGRPGREQPGDAWPPRPAAGQPGEPWAPRPAAAEDVPRRIERLKRTPLFEGLTDDELAHVAALMRPRRYRRGMFVFVEGDPVEAVYFIESGSVKASTTGPDGREHIISVLGPGDFFPHVGFLDGGPAPGTAEALEDCSLWVIRRADFYRLLTENPVLAVRMVAVLSARIRRLQMQLRDLATQSVPARVAQALLNLCHQHGALAPSPGAPQAVRIELALSHQDLAALVGTTRESVSRVLSGFRKAGLVSLEQGRFVVRDPSGLQRWCS